MQINGRTKNVHPAFSLAVLLATSLLFIPPHALGQESVSTASLTAEPRNAKIGDSVVFTYDIDLDDLPTVPTGLVTFAGIQHDIPAGLIIDPASLSLDLPGTAAGNLPTGSVLEVVDNTIQFADGVTGFTFEKQDPGNDLRLQYVAKLVAPTVNPNGFENKIIVNINDAYFVQGTAEIGYISTSVVDCTDVIGKVFEDLDGNGRQNNGEIGIPGARLVNTMGYNIITDSDGRFHVPCAGMARQSIGSNYILKLMLNSLPQNFETTTENPRVFRLTEGKMSAINFGVRHTGATPFTTVRFEVNDTAFVKGSTALRPDMRDDLQELVDVLLKQPTSLALINVGGEKVLERSNALANRISSEFVSAGGVYDLNIAQYDENGTLIN